MATQWRHVPSKVNPADLVSRGMQPDKFKECSLWFYGPLFLSGPESSWPSTPSGVEPDLEKKKSKVCLTISEERQSLLTQIDHHNSWKRLQRTVAYMVRFTSNSRERDHEKRQLDNLTVDELTKTTTLIIKETQEEGFPEDIADLRRHGSINSSSSLASLQPFIDQNGLIRVGGRLAEANLSYDAKHPILLPYNHIITRLIFIDNHIDNHIDNAHIGPQGLLSTVRQRFWPVKGKTTARNVVQNCVRCARVKPKLLTQLMGNLPSTRVQPGRPFINTGVDFCGPFWTHLKIRGKKPLKSYVAVFCCFSTKAIHLEVVSDLTTEAFIGALKRFVGRRGYCRNIYCDNATNFVGARNQLTELQDTIYSSQAKERISTFCTSKNIDFHFIPPRAPHFGGLWEAAVKSAKHLFQKSLAAAALTYEELSTAMVEIEAILNSRPLTPMSNDPNDLTALTPGHFLIGEPLTALVDPHANPTKGNLLYRWKLVSQLKTELWHRWRKEYLSELQYRHKWTKINDNVEPGLMVVLKEDNVLVLSWPLGRIINVIKGNDGLARVADVKTATGILRRPIARLAPLPIKTEIEEQNCISQEAEAMKKPPSDADSEHEETQPRKRRRMGGFNPVNLFLVTCFLLPLIVFGQITVKPFNNQPGLYFEGMGTTKLTSSDWNLVVYFNMNPYWKELEFLSHGVNQLQAICRSKLDQTACNDTIIQFLRVITEINNTNELLSEHPPGRRRRSPFNVVGSIARSLFGGLDSTYAEDMSKIITNVGNNQDHLMMLIKNQTTLIDSTTNVIQKSQEGIQKQVTEFNQRMNQTIIAVNNMESEIQRQNILEVFNELSVRLFLTISHFQRMQSVLLDVVSHAHQGKVNPILLTPNQLREQLAVIKDHLPPNLQIPAANSHLLELYQLMAIESRITSTKIIFRLQLPLLIQETFEMFHLVPIPTMINQTFLILKTRSTYLITNLHRDVFYPLSGEELSQCYLMKNPVHVCKLNHLLGRKNTQQDACELNLLTQSSTPPSCTFIPLKRVPRWTRLLATNQWMYVTNEEAIVNVMCGHTLNRTTISGAGIMTITQGCTVTDEVTTIHAHNIVSTSLAASFVPTKNVTANLPTKELTKLLLPPIDQLNITDDINALRQRIKELQNKENLEPINALHKVHHLTVSYACLSTVTIIMMWLIWRRCNMRPHISHPTPAHRQEGGDFEFQPTA